MEFNIQCPEYGYHCTSEKKLEMYSKSGRIIAPVRFWPNLYTAQQWCKHTSRPIILKIKLPGISYPLPDHKPARWCPYDVTEYEQQTDKYMESSST